MNLYARLPTIDQSYNDVHCVKLFEIIPFMFQASVLCVTAYIWRSKC